MENNISTKEEKISWTTQQTHVIDTRDGNLLVSAAAGSGKTAVLVERIIEMVLGTDSKGNRLMDKEPMDVDELLVVTFTNAAAAQMKEKIGDALQKKVDAMMARGEHDEHLIRQMTLINHANICTIDSFCLQIVKEYFAKVELDSAFDIADDMAFKPCIFGAHPRNRGYFPLAEVLYLPAPQSDRMLLHDQYDSRCDNRACTDGLQQGDI